MNEGCLINGLKPPAFTLSNTTPLHKRIGY